jgi:peptide/nickel transport system permease protein
MTLHIDIPEENLASILGKAFRNRSFLAGFVITVLVAAVAVLSYVWTPYDVTRLIIADRTQAPSLAHWFGTDHFGRDILSMIMVGARNSIAVALVAVGIGMGIGVPLGPFAAARGGLVDEALMRLNDLVFAFPAIILAMVVTAIFGPGAVNAIIAIGIFNIPVFARVARRRAGDLAARIHPAACRRQGQDTDHHRARVPNIATLLLVTKAPSSSLWASWPKPGFPTSDWCAAPMPSWGRMLFDAQTRMVVAPVDGDLPGMAIAVTVLRAEPARRRHCRHARSEIAAAAMSLLEIEDLR